MQLLEEEEGVLALEMLQHEQGVGEVHGAVGDVGDGRVDAPGVADVGQLDHAGPGQLEHPGRGVDGPQGGAARGEVARHAADPAAEIEGDAPGGGGARLGPGARPGEVGGEAVGVGPARRLERLHVGGVEDQGHRVGVGRRVPQPAVAAVGSGCGLPVLEAPAGAGRHPLDLAETPHGDPTGALDEGGLVLHRGHATGPGSPGAGARAALA